MYNIANEGYPSMGFPNPSPLNFPQSCTSNDAFPLNTPNENKMFLDSTKNNFSMPMFGLGKYTIIYDTVHVAIR